MDIFYSLSLSLLIFFTTAVLLKLINRSQNLPNPNEDKIPLPPGTTGWPLLGETQDFISKTSKGALRKFITDRTTKYSPKIFKTSLMGQPVAILPGPEGNKLLFSNEDKLVQVWHPESIDKIFGQTHANRQEFGKVRKMLHSFLKPDALKRNVALMDKVTKQHLSTHWQSQEERDKLVDVIVRDYTLSLACQIFLSIDDPFTVRELTSNIEDIKTGMHSLPINFPGTAYRGAIKASRMICEKIRVLVRQRRVDIEENRASVTQDMLSTLIVATNEDGDFYDEVDIANNLVGLLVGGYSTLNGLLTFMIKCLAELPHVYNEVLREQMEIRNSKEPTEFLTWEDMKKMSYTWNVGNETLRLHPDAIGTFREAITDFTHAGYRIPKGWKIFCIAHDTHKNPEYFSDPDKFDPSRFEGNGPLPYTFVPFGGGPRMCPGNEYTRLAILVFVHNLVTNFRLEKVIRNEKDLNVLDLVPDHGLLIRLHPHNHGQT